MMIPLVALSLLSYAVILERFSAFRRANVDTATLRREVMALIKRGELAQATQLCANTPGPVSAILLVGLRKYDKLKKMKENDIEKIDNLVTKAMSDFAPHVIDVLETRLYLLAMVGTVAPLLGLMGTVTGMIKVFAHVGEDVSQVGPGISEALIATAFGLITAVPAVWIYTILSRRVEKYVLEIEETATKLVEFVTMGSE